MENISYPKLFPKSYIAVHTLTTFASSDFISRFHCEVVMMTVRANSSYYTEIVTEIRTKTIWLPIVSETPWVPTDTFKEAQTYSNTSISYWYPTSEIIYTEYAEDGLFRIGHPTNSMQSELGAITWSSVASDHWSTITASSTATPMENGQNSFAESSGEISTHVQDEQQKSEESTWEGNHITDAEIETTTVADEAVSETATYDKEFEEKSMYSDAFESLDLELGSTPSVTVPDDLCETTAFPVASTLPDFDAPVSSLVEIVPSTKASSGFSPSLTSKKTIQVSSSIETSTITHSGPQFPFLDATNKPNFDQHSETRPMVTERPHSSSPVEYSRRIPNVTRKSFAGIVLANPIWYSPRDNKRRGNHSSGVSSKLAVNKWARLYAAVFLIVAVAAMSI